MYTRDFLTYRTIAQKLGIQYRSAYFAVKRCQAKLNEQFKVEARELMDLHTHKLDTLAEEALADYRAGKRPRKTVKIVTRLAASDEDKARADEQGMVRERVEEVRPGAANPALLAQARGGLQDIRNIWGAEAAKIIEVRTAEEDDAMPAEHAFMVGMFNDGMRSAATRMFARREAQQQEDNPDGD